MKTCRLGHTITGTNVLPVMGKYQACKKCWAAAMRRRDAIKRHRATYLNAEDRLVSVTR